MIWSPIYIFNLIHIAFSCSLFLEQYIKLFPLCLILHTHHQNSTSNNGSNKMWILAFGIDKVHSLFPLLLSSRISADRIYLPFLILQPFKQLKCIAATAIKYLQPVIPQEQDKALPQIIYRYHKKQYWLLYWYLKYYTSVPLMERWWGPEMHVTSLLKLSCILLKLLK